MITYLKTGTFPGDWTWIDVEEPTQPELEKLAAEHNLHPAAVQDCLQPDHLPKYEAMDGYEFLIMRMFDPDEPMSTNLRKLTHKIAIFFNEGIVISIHRKPQEFIYAIKHNFVDCHKCKNTEHLVSKLLKQTLLSYDKPTDLWQKELDFYEGGLIRKERPPALPRGLYQVKQQTSAIKRVLMVTLSSLDMMADAYENDPYINDLKETAHRVLLVYDDMLDRSNTLLNFYLNLSTARTNEVMRVLTIMSTLFLPLTFIVGIFGMNYQWMPTVAEPFGFWYCCGFMLLLTGGLIAYFRHKNWL
jgi:magnesium transporter